jgi:tetratricopeptide (TPR) repeat protein
LLWPGPVWAIPAPLELEDRPQPFSAQRATSEADEDRVQALALFAAGRTFEQRQEYDRALQYFERAYRYDPTATAAADAVVLLALHQRQLAVAARYAIKTIDVVELGTQVPLRLAEYLTENGDYEHAVTLYEKVIAARTGGQPDGDELLLRMEIGRLDYLLGRHAKAAEQFALVAEALEHPQRFGLSERTKKELLGNAGLAYLLFGESFLLSGRLAEATAAFQKSNSVAPNQPLVDYNLARVAARKGQTEQALADLRRALDKHLNSEGLAPAELLAELLAKLGREKELLGELERLHKADPDNVPLGYFLAGKYLSAGRLEQAADLYAALLKKGPTTIAFRSLAEIDRKLKRAEPLLALLGSVVEKSATLDLLGEGLQALAGDAETWRLLLAAGGAGAGGTGLPVPKPAGGTGVAPVPKPGTGQPPLPPRKHPSDFNQCLALALLADQRKEFDLAAEFFDAALAAQPKQAAQVLLTWGVGLLVAERPAEAVKVFQRAGQQKLMPPDNPALDYYLAGALALGDHVDEALTWARKAAAAKRDSAQMALREPWILERAKRHEAAIRAYADVVTRFDADQKAETRDSLRIARLALSNLCVLGNRLPEAEQWLEQVLDEFPDDVSAANDLGYLWADQGKHLQRALRMIQFAVAAEPENSAYRDSLGWAFYRLGRFPEAVAELQKAARDKEPDAVIFDHLGDACLRAGQPERAHDAWRRAAEAFRREKEPEKARQTERKITK